MKTVAAAPNASPEFVGRLRAQLLTASQTTEVQPAPSLWQRLWQNSTRPQGRGRWLVSALGTVAVVGAVVFIALNLTTPVSAQQILERASAAQLAAEANLGIRHVRIEHYQNLLGMSGAQAGNKTMIESYENASSGFASSRVLADISAALLQTQTG